MISIPTNELFLGTNLLLCNVMPNSKVIIYEENQKNYMQQVPDG